MKLAFLKSKNNNSKINNFLPSPSILKRNNKFDYNYQYYYNYTNIAIYKKKFERSIIPKLKKVKDISPVKNRIKKNYEIYDFKDTNPINRIKYLVP